MKLEIKNIKTQKEKYIFGEDTQIQLSFDIEANDKEYEINGIYVHHGIEIRRGASKYMEHLEKIQISQATHIATRGNKNISCRVPMQYPNVKIQDIDPRFKKIPENNENLLEVINVIEILVDIKHNPFDCKTRYYPDIEINKEYRGADLVRKTPKIEKNDQNYIPMNHGARLSQADCISKEFYNYINKKYRFFAWYNIFKGANRYITLALYLGSIIGACYVIFSYANIDMLFFIYVIIFSLAIYFFLSLFIQKQVVKKISKDIIRIHLKDKKYITEKFHNRSLSLRDIFESINIDYPGDYSCEFHCSLNCELKMRKKIGSGNSTRIVIFRNNIFSLKLGEYSGSDFTLENIQALDSIKSLEKLYKEPGYIKRNGYLSGEGLEIIYTLSYDFSSPDIFNAHQSIPIS